MFGHSGVPPCYDWMEYLTYRIDDAINNYKRKPILRPGFLLTFPAKEKVERPKQQA